MSTPSGRPADGSTVRKVVAVTTAEVDYNSASAFEAELAPHLDPPTSVVLDLTAVTFLDSSGLQVLQRARQSLVDAGGTLHVDHVAPIVRRVLDVSGMNDLLLGADVGVDGEGPPRPSSG